MILCRTPFRISFFGGGTDYPAWYREHGGAVVATTIDKYCYLSCRYLPPFFEHRYRVVYSQIDTCRTIEEIRHPSARAVLQFMQMAHGVEVHHDGDLPARSGMGSSSAFTVGLLHAMHAIKGERVSKKQLVAESLHVEQELLKETVGSQDQVLAAHGGLNHITFHPDGSIDVCPLTLPAERIAQLNAHLMLFYTGIKRTASDVAKSYVADIAAKQRQLHAMRGFVDQAVALLSSRDDLVEFGRLLHETWLAKRSLSSCVTNPDVDAIYDAARSAGALGGKLTGAGGGGFLLLFATPDLHAAIRDKLGGILCVPFRFETHGSQIIFYDPGEDYSDTEKDRANRTIRAFYEWKTGVPA